MEYDYNTKRKKLILPEYGRNIQKMVDHIMSIEDRDERNKAAKTIIAVMGNLNPHLRDINDFKHKLWDHLAVISASVDEAVLMDSLTLQTCIMTSIKANTLLNVNGY